MACSHCGAYDSVLRNLLAKGEKGIQTDIVGYNTVEKTTQTFPSRYSRGTYYESPEPMEVQGKGKTLEKKLHQEKDKKTKGKKRRILEHTAKRKKKFQSGKDDWNVHASPKGTDADTQTEGKIFVLRPTNARKRGCMVSSTADPCYEAVSTSSPIEVGTVECDDEYYPEIGECLRLLKDQFDPGTPLTSNADGGAFPEGNAFLNGENQMRSEFIKEWLETKVSAVSQSGQDNGSS